MTKKGGSSPEKKVMSDTSSEQRDDKWQRSAPQKGELNKQKNKNPPQNNKITYKQFNKKHNHFKQIEINFKDEPKEYWSHEHNKFISYPKYDQYLKNKNYGR